MTRMHSAVTLIVLSAICLAVSPVANAIEWEPYTYKAAGNEVDAELGHITVPENRSDPNSRQIELTFVRFKSTSPNPGSPIVYLAGGPGGSGIASGRGARFPVFMAMREFGDVIALDQRGTGQSEPKMMYAGSGRLPLDKPATREAMSALYAKQARSMAAEMERRGIDLRGYTTNENADDINDLRKALGADKLTLWGTSYGTHLAFAVIRRHGAHVDKVILHGIEGPDQTDKLPSDVQRQLETIHRLAASDPQVSAKIPDLMTALTEVLNRFRESPITFNTSPGAGRAHNIVVGSFELQVYLAGQIGRRAGIEHFPATLYALMNGEYLDFARWALQSRRFGLISAMAAAMDTASGASPERQQRIQRETKECILGNAINFPFPEIRASVPVPDAGDEFRAPLHSDVPALFISGTIDGRTPVSNAEEMLEGFPNGELLIIENVGHGDDLFVASPKILEAMQTFMRGENLQTTRIEMPFHFQPIE